MTWMAWRQVRMSTAVAAGLVLAVAVLLAVTGPHLTHLYSLYRSCSGYSCGTYLSQLGNADRHVDLVGTGLIAMPAVLGIFIGAPLISRELENGTHRLAWTQGVSRTRWIVTRVGLGALIVAVATGALSFAFTWWSIPFDHTGTNRIDPSVFGERGIAPVAYALFAFALGVAASALFRRTLAAMAVTLGGFIAVRMVVQFIVRQHLITPLSKVIALTDRAPFDLMGASTGPRLVAHNPDLPNTWVLSTKLVDSAGRPPTSAAVRQACRTLINQPPPARAPAPGVHVKQATPQVIQAFQECAHNVGLRYHAVVSYQPVSRFWALQWIESAIFVGLAIAMLGLAVYWVRRRLV